MPVPCVARVFCAPGIALTGLFRDCFDLHLDRFLVLWIIAGDRDLIFRGSLRHWCEHDCHDVHPAGADRDSVSPASLRQDRAVLGRSDVGDQNSAASIGDRDAPRGGRAWSGAQVQGEIAIWMLIPPTDSDWSPHDDGSASRCPLRAGKCWSRVD